MSGIVSGVNQDTVCRFGVTRPHGARPSMPMNPNFSDPHFAEFAGPRLDSAVGPAEPERLMLDRAAARALDAEALSRFGIPEIVLMENAARGLAAVASAMLRGTGRSVVVICGPGNNGGDGYAAARHLSNWSHSVRLIRVGTPRPETAAGLNASICAAMAMPTADISLLGDGAAATLVIDALFGTGLDRPPTGAAAAAIAAINDARRRGALVLAADLPSGLDCDSGECLGSAVVADRTSTFAALKPGLLRGDGPRHAGAIDVVDIGVPRELLRRLASS